MKILAIHNFHRKGSASGDDQVFKNETELFEAHGDYVIRYTVQNDVFDKKGIIGKVLSAFGMLWSFKHYNAVKSLIQDEKPDIVHIHTFFPLLSPSILYAAKSSGIKVVSTLHDARFVCPCSTSLRGTELCNKCGDGRYFRMCKYRCFKNSLLQSFMVAFIFTYHWIRKSFYKQIDQYICLNDNQIRLLIDIGFEEKKIVKKYNFVPDTEGSRFVGELPILPERYVVYYGRIEKEKGIRVLQQIWEKLPEIPLVVMGGGPLEDEFSTWAMKNKQIYYLGYTQHDKCLEIVRHSEFVVFPSILYEGCSMVEIEAEGLGKALVATDIGFSVEAIEDGYNGYKIPLADIACFRETIKNMWNNKESTYLMGINARRDYETKYMSEDNYVQLMKIYMEK
jgi:glycosyltransferase involved in cell wall biosynthesis